MWYTSLVSIKRHLSGYIAPTVVAISLGRSWVIWNFWQIWCDAVSFCGPSQEYSHLHTKQRDQVYQLLLRVSCLCNLQVTNLVPLLCVVSSACLWYGIEHSFRVQVSMLFFAVTYIKLCTSEKIRACTTESRGVGGHWLWFQWMALGFHDSCISREKSTLQVKDHCKLQSRPHARGGCFQILCCYKYLDVKNDQWAATAKWLS